MITLWRIVVASWKNLGRNAWIGLATVFVFVMALLSVNVLLGVNAVLGQTLAVLEDRIDVTVSFKATAPEDVVKQARSYLSGLPQVKEVAYRSAADVLADFKVRHAGESQVLGALEEINANPLGPEIVFKAKSATDYPFLIQAIQSPQYSSFIQKQTYEDHQIAIARIQEIGRSVRIVGAILVAIFALFGLLIAFNAIRVAVYTQREEIAIMRLVGASSFYIRAPFILGGIWLALFSLLLCAVAIYFLVPWIDQVIAPLLDGAPGGLRDFFFSQALLVAGLEAGGLIVLVSFVSSAAVGKYIKR